MAYDWSGALGSLLGGSNIDTRTPEAIQQGQRGQQMAGGMQQEYANATNNPNYGVGTPEQQQYQEQELANSVRNRTGAAGSGGSGFEADQVRKAMVDFRIGQIGQRQAALNNLRQGMVQANQAGWPQPMTHQQGAFQRAGQNLVSAGGTMLGNAMFGQDPNKNPNQPNQPGTGQPGTNGFRVNGPGLPGGQSGGPGNSSYYSNDDN